jgi:hypothetical protein
MKSLAAHRVALAAAILLIAWLVMILVRVENERYALSLGMCFDNPNITLPNYECLDGLETRTAWWWHVYYAVQEFGSLGHRHS